jgi:hypothetical protein
MKTINNPRAFNAGGASAELDCPSAFTLIELLVVIAIIRSREPREFKLRVNGEAQTITSGRL